MNAALLFLCLSVAHAAEPAAIDWVAIPGGSFEMGRGLPQAGGKVTVPPFELSRSAVTNAQYAACVKAGACQPARDYGRRFSLPGQPVVGVTWPQAETFARWAGGRLPSESEWEYAAYSLGKGEEKAPDCGWVVFDDKKLGFGCGRGAPWPVCSKPAGNTAQGLCDMAGNVLEWVADAVPEGTSFKTGLEEAPPPAPRDGSPRAGKPGDRRLQRGMAWDDTDTMVPSMIQRMELPGMETDFLGFRVARRPAR